MSEDQDDSQKTEEPSEKRLEDSREEGRVFTSKELTTFLSLSTLAIMLQWVIPPIFRQICLTLGKIIEWAHNPFAPSDDSGLSVTAFLSSLMQDLVWPFLALTLPFTIMGITSSLLQHGIIYAPKVIFPKLERISPIAGWKRIFSLSSSFELLKGMCKIAIIGFAIYITIAPEVPLILGTKSLSLVEMVKITQQSLSKMVSMVAIIMFFLGIGDYLYQRYNYYKKLRMTKQEVKDEYKQMQGNPEVKSRMKKIGLQRIRQSLQKIIPEATVVITNPTHYSVALRYNAEEMAAPVVVAKGVDDLALEIRRVAREHAIPIVENQTLARALYAEVGVDEEIAEGHYRTVAGIMSYVMQLQQLRQRHDPRGQTRPKEKPTAGVGSGSNSGKE